MYEVECTMYSLYLSCGHVCMIGCQEVPHWYLSESRLITPSADFTGVMHFHLHDHDQTWLLQCCTVLKYLSVLVSQQSHHFSEAKCTTNSSKSHQSSQTSDLCCTVTRCLYNVIKSGIVRLLRQLLFLQVANKMILHHYKLHYWPMSA